MPSIATVTTLPLAIFFANIPPATSIWLNNHPPKISPLGFVSAGIATVLVNITSGSDLTTDEFEVIGSKIREIANEDAKIITGCIKEDDNIGDLRVTIIATGFSQDNTIKASSSDASLSIEENTATNPSVSYTSNSEVKKDVIPQVNVSLQEDQTSIDIPAFLRQQADW